MDRPSGDEPYGAGVDPALDAYLLDLIGRIGAGTAELAAWFCDDVATWFRPGATYRYCWNQVLADYLAALPNQLRVVNGGNYHNNRETRKTDYGRKLTVLVRAWIQELVRAPGFEEKTGLSPTLLSPLRRTGWASIPADTASALATVLQRFLGPAVGVIYRGTVTILQDADIVSDGAPYSATTELAALLERDGAVTGDRLLRGDLAALAVAVAHAADELLYRMGRYDMTPVRPASIQALGDPAADLVISQEAGVEPVKYLDDPAFLARLARRKAQMDKSRMGNPDWDSPLVLKGQEEAIADQARGVAIVTAVTERETRIYRGSGLDIDGVAGEVHLHMFRYCHGFAGRIGEKQLRRETRQYARRLIGRWLDERGRQA